MQIIFMVKVKFEDRCHTYICLTYVITAKTQSVKKRSEKGETVNSIQCLLKGKIHCPTTVKLIAYMLYLV